jgi:uncharacterized membrane protein YgdD (TMEM256/DUF423 family)
MESSKHSGHVPAMTLDRVANTFWKRAVWMRLGALNGLMALCLLLLADSPIFASGQEASIRLGAQIQFMHGMATLACATFMNIGASGARMAPAFFLSGILFYCMPIYAGALGLLGVTALAKPVGLSAFAVGWLVLAWSARDIDRS